MADFRMPMRTAERVCGRNAPKVKRGVDNRHEKVCGANNSKFVGQAVDGGIIIGVPANNQIFPRDGKRRGKIVSWQRCAFDRLQVDVVTEGVAPFIMQC
jgi:hypothetical protein